MTDIVTELERLVGVPPAGFEWLSYLLAGVFLLFLVSSAVGVISAVFRWIGGK